jgi:hypothetical protein
MQQPSTEIPVFFAGGDASRKRGRPRCEPTEPVMTRLPLPLYDQIVKTANRRGESVSSVVRALLTLRVRRELP